MIMDYLSIWDVHQLVASCRFLRFDFKSMPSSMLHEPHFGSMIRESRILTPFDPTPISGRSYSVAIAPPLWTHHILLWRDCLVVFRFLTSMRTPWGSKCEGFARYINNDFDVEPMVSVQVMPLSLVAHFRGSHVVSSGLDVVTAPISATVIPTATVTTAAAATTTQPSNINSGPKEEKVPPLPPPVPTSWLGHVDQIFESGRGDWKDALTRRCRELRKLLGSHGDVTFFYLPIHGGAYAVMHSNRSITQDALSVAFDLARWKWILIRWCFTKESRKCVIWLRSNSHVIEQRHSRDLQHVWFFPPRLSSSSGNVILSTLVARTKNQINYEEFEIVQSAMIARSSKSCVGSIRKQLLACDIDDVLVLICAGTRMQFENPAVNYLDYFRWFPSIVSGVTTMVQQRYMLSTPCAYLESLAFVEWDMAEKKKLVTCYISLAQLELSDEKKSWVFVLPHPRWRHLPIVFLYHGEKPTGVLFREPLAWSANSLSSLPSLLSKLSGRLKLPAK